MTTSDPRTGQHDDNPREHRGLGKRLSTPCSVIRPSSGPTTPPQTAPQTAPRTGPQTLPTPTPTGADRPAESRAGGAPAGYAGEGPRSEPASYEQAMRDSAPGGVVQDDRGTGQGGTGRAGYADPREATRDAGHDPSGIATDARRDAGYDAGTATGTPTDTRRDAGTTPQQLRPTHGAMPVTTTPSPELPATTPATPVVTPSLRTPRTTSSGGLRGSASRGPEHRLRLRAVPRDRSAVDDRAVPGGLRDPELRPGPRDGGGRRTAGTGTLPGRQDSRAARGAMTSTRDAGYVDDSRTARPATTTGLRTPHTWTRRAPRRTGPPAVATTTTTPGGSMRTAGPGG